MPTQPINTANRAELPPLGGGPPLPPLGGGPPPILTCTRFNNKTWQEYQTWLSAYQQSYEHTYHRPLKCIYGTPREISHKKIPPQAKILVIEMNNDENRIMGIGEIQNQTANEVYRTLPSSPSTLPFRKLFSDRNYTRYIYLGNSRYASREELERNHTEDAQYINKQLEGLLPQHATTATATATTATATTATATATATSPPPPPSNSTVGEYLRQNYPPSWGGGTTLERLLFKGARHMKRGSGITKIPHQENKQQK